MKTTKEILIAYTKFLREMDYFGKPPRIPIKGYVGEFLDVHHEQKLNSSGIGSKRLTENSIDWKNLRQRFFKECTTETPRENEMKKVNMAPHDLFEWFKAACASGGEDTVAEDWVATPKPKVPLEKRLDNLSKKIRARKSSEGQRFHPPCFIDGNQMHR